MEILNRAAKCSILGPQNLGSGGGPGPRGPPPGSAAEAFVLFGIKGTANFEKPLAVLLF